MKTRTPQPGTVLAPVVAPLLATVLATVLAFLATTLLAAPVTAQEAPAEDYGRIILLLDSSGSMAEPTGGGQTKIEAAKDALMSVVDELPDASSVGLRVFGSEVFSRSDAGACEDSRLVVAPSTDNRDDLRGAIASYKPYGETPIPHALREAAADLGDEGPRSIVLVSDGESTCDPDPCVVAEDLAEKGIDLRIDVVGLSVSGEAREQLQCIAERGLGTYYDAADAAEIRSKLIRVAQRAIRPFVLTGEPIRGGSEASPTPVTVGDWTDELGPWKSPREATHYVFTRTTTDTTLRVSAVTQGVQGDDGLGLEILAPDGSRCAIGNTIRQIDTRRVVGVQATAGPESDCGEPGDYLVRVDRALATEGDAPFGLRVTEEPPITATGFTGDGEVEVTTPQVSGKPQEAPSGQSFADAGEIGPGRWSGTIVPGEAAMYRLPLGFGQEARIAVTFPEPGPAEQQAIDGEYTLGQIVLYNPMQGQLAHPDDATFSGRVGTEAMTFVTATPAISRDLVDSGGVNGVEDYSTAGDYYLAVSAMRADHSVEMPFTVDVEVVGEPAEGPTYADGASWTVAGGTVTAEDPTPSPEPDSTGTPGVEATPEGEDADGLLPTGAAVGVGLVGLAAVLGAVVLWRRRSA